MKTSKGERLQLPSTGLKLRGASAVVISANARTILYLQRTAGNGAVAQALMAGELQAPLPSIPVQRGCNQPGKPRRLEGVSFYGMTSKKQLLASGYKYLRRDGYFDIWCSPNGGELLLQVPKVNAATSEAAIARLGGPKRSGGSGGSTTGRGPGGIVATRKAQLDAIDALAKAAKSTDPDVAETAQEELETALREFPGFDDDYALVRELRAQVDAEHKDEFEALVRALAEQRDRYDPQSDLP
jgi:hypothetical protein